MGRARWGAIEIREPLVGLLEVAPFAVIGFMLLGFMLFAAGMIRPTEDEEKQYSLVVVDDDPDIRRGLKTLVEARTPFAVVGEAHNGMLGVHVVDALRPEVVIMDVKLAGVDGIEATRRIKSIDRNIAVIGYSAPEDDATGAIMRGAGASAHLVKGDAPDHIVGTILSFADPRAAPD